MKIQAMVVALAGILAFGLEAMDAQAQTSVGGIVILNRVTWTLEDSPYIVVNDFIIEPGGHLIIEPGVEIRFQPMARSSGYDQAKAEFIVRGNLTALGSSALDRDILFTSNAENPLPGDWAGIQFEHGGRGELRYTTIEYADQGVRCCFTEDVVLEGNTIRYCTCSGISIHTSSADILSNSITDSRGHGMLASSALLNVQGNLIADNEGYGILWSNSKSKNSVIRGNTVNYNRLCGLFLYHFYGRIQGNYIADNGRNGIALFESQCEIVGNQVSDNAHAAVLSYHSKPWIEHNRMTHNRVGIEAQHRSEVEAHTNNLYDNTDYNVLISAPLQAKLSGSVVQAEDNWWGVTDVQQASGTMLGFFTGSIRFLPLSTLEFPFSLERFSQAEASE